MATLSDYLAETRRLLHDPSDVYWSLTDKTANINKAIQQRDLLTGCNRNTYSFPMVAGTDTYSLTTIGSARIFDVIGMYVIQSSLRVPLDFMSMSELNAYVRQYSPLQRGMPQAWTRYGHSSVIVAPAPSLAYTSEADCAIVAAAGSLVALADDDAMPYAFTEPVPYYAAHLCKLNERQSDESAGFLEEFHRLINVITGSRQGTVPTMYASR